MTEECLCFVDDGFCREQCWLLLLHLYIINPAVAPAKHGTYNLDHGATKNRKVSQRTGKTCIRTCNLKHCNMPHSSYLFVVVATCKLFICPVWGYPC
ncbi:MAG: hypothetical protein BGP13_22780 [Sphingobacteriales bacterium 40-81]|nr:MAG: hypothetical protein BGP13_22780 [Sphingobacteriales bacterium 40-81]